MVQVLLDTNFMYLPFQRKVDIYKLLAGELTGPVELTTLSQCMDELAALSPGAAELARKKVRVIHTEGPADKAILKYSRGKDIIVCTQDAQLRGKMRKQNVRVLSWSNGRLR